MLENWLSLDPESRSTDWSWTLGLDRYQIPQRSQRLSWHRAWGLRLHPDYRHSEILNTGVESNLRHLCAEVCVSVWMCVPVQVRGTVAVWKYERSITERDVHLYTVYMSHLEVIQNKNTHMPFADVKWPLLLSEVIAQLRMHRQQHVEGVRVILTCVVQMPGICPSRHWWDGGRWRPTVGLHQFALVRHRRGGGSLSVCLTGCRCGLGLCDGSQCRLEGGGAVELDPRKTPDKARGVVALDEDRVYGSSFCT